MAFPNQILGVAREKRYRRVIATQNVLVPIAHSSLEPSTHKEEQSLATAQGKEANKHFVSSAQSAVAVQRLLIRRKCFSFADGVLVFLTLGLVPLSNHAMERHKPASIDDSALSRQEEAWENCNLHEKLHQCARVQEKQPRTLDLEKRQDALLLHQP